ncbi:MAG: FHA domain-containing protein [Gammaproteobacteria bacterium]|nr:FHA domain-containing protein [Gammaproteobacteria bacterium]
MMAKLVHCMDGTVLGEYPLTKKGKLRIGRRPGNDIQLDDLTVSGNHATVSVQASPYVEGRNDVYVEDRGSTNGTQVNGKAVHFHLLKHGDVLRIGSHEFRYVDEENLGFERTQIFMPDGQG